MAKDDTPLHIAALGGSLFAVYTLIDEFKCDPNTKGSTAKYHWDHSTYI